MARKIDPAVAAAVADAVRSVEVSSSAEVVIEIRTRSASYAEADARFGAVVAFGALLFVLFSPWNFAELWVPVAVAGAYVAGILMAHVAKPVQRLMTTRQERERKVRRAAAACFYERGVANTEQESGLLIYLSLLERRIELIADRGLLDAVPVLEWNQIVVATRTQRATPASLLEVLRTLAPLLTRYLPAKAADRDELPDKVHFVTE